MSGKFQKLVSDVCRADTGNSEMNNGQAREVLSKIALLDAQHRMAKKPMGERPLTVLRELAREKLAELRKAKAGK